MHFELETIKSIYYEAITATMVPVLDSLQIQLPSFVKFSPPTQPASCGAYANRRTNLSVKLLHTFQQDGFHSVLGENLHKCVLDCLVSDTIYSTQQQLNVKSMNITGLTGCLNCSSV